MEETTLTAHDGDRLLLLIRLPNSAIKKLVNGEEWQGSVHIAKKKEPKRAVAIRQQISESKRHKNFTRATIDERKVIRAWNRSSYIKKLEESGYLESRNQALPFRKIAENLPLVQQVLRSVGLIEILRSMEAYFDFCSRGDHIWDGHNHGFKTLTGFLSKLLELHKKRERGWWDVREDTSKVAAAQDEYPRLTKRIANSFAKTFLSEDKFDLEMNPKAHRQFIKTAKEIRKYIDRQKRRGVELSERDVIVSLLRLVCDLFDDDGQTVYPGHLSCNGMWSSAFPQYMKESGLV